jgi:hypothetical protein
VRVVALVIIQILQFTFVVQRFFATREFFGTGAALFALIIASFDPISSPARPSSLSTWA